MKESYELLKIEQYDLLSDTVDSIKRDYLVFDLLITYLWDGSDEERMITDTKLLLLDKIRDNMKDAIAQLKLVTKKHSNLYVTQATEEVLYNRKRYK